MKEIPLKRGKYALVDNEDFERLLKYKWFYTNGYAMRTGYNEENKRSFPIYMHREIIKPTGKKEIDHINGNGLDNRKNNLRICFHAENRRNGMKYKNNTSGYKGVNWYKKYSKWRAKICVDYKTIHLGYFKNKLKAVWAYDKAAQEYHGEFAKLNSY